MKRSINGLLLGIVTLLVAAPAAQAQLVLVPKGSKISVVLLTSLKSNGSRVGDRVKATTLEESNDILPEGTMITGTVTEVQPREKNQSGMVKVVFTRATLSNGRNLWMEAEPEEFKVASSGGNTQKNAVTGAAIGAGAGLILNKNKETGAVIGGLLGGLIGASSTSKSTSSDFEIKSGATIRLVLTKSMKVPDFSATPAREEVAPIPAPAAPTPPTAPAHGDHHAASDAPMKAGATDKADEASAAEAPSSKPVAPKPTSTVKPAAKPKANTKAGAKKKPGLKKKATNP